MSTKPTQHTTEDDGQDTGTLRWDTVFAMSFPEINRAIERGGRYEKSFEQPEPESGYTVRGAFDAWRVAKGGSGQILHLELPVRGCEIDVGRQVIPLGDGVATVALRLAFQPVERASATGRHELRVRAEPRREDRRVASVSLVFDAPGAQTERYGSTVEMELEQWLTEHLHRFDHVFATVDIAAEASGDFAWMQPTAGSRVAYACSSGGEGSLGILCMTGDRKGDHLAAQISDTAIPEGCSAGLVIARDRVLVDLVQPHLPVVFRNSHPEDYEWAADADHLTIGRDRVAFRAEHDGEARDCQLEDLTIDIEQSTMKVSSQTRTNVSPGIDAVCETKSSLELALVPSKTGGQTLGFTQTDSDENHWTEVGHGLSVAEKVLAGVAAFVGLVVLVVGTDGAILPVIASILAMVAAGTAIDVAVIQGWEKGDAPAIDGDVLNAAARVQWPDATGFEITQADFDGSMRLGGHIETRPVGPELRAPAREPMERQHVR